MGLAAELLHSATGQLSHLHALPAWLVALTALFVLVALSVVVNVLRQIIFKDKIKPPLVFHWLPFLGSTLRYGMDPYKFFNQARATYGDTFTFVLVGRKMTMCLGPAGNELVFNSKLSHVNAEEAYTGLTTPVFGSGVAYDCPNHVLMEQKKFIKYGLTAESFRSYVPLIRDEVEQFCKRSKHFKGTRYTVPLSEIIPQLTIYTASRSLQGKEVRDAFDGSIAALFHDLDMAFIPINFLFPNMPLPLNFRRDVAQKKMAAIYKAIIKKRRESAKESEHDMMWNLMNQRYKNGRSLSDTEIAHIMIALLMAGQHTSMATSTWMLLHLATKPDLVQELYEEQIRVLGNDLELSYEKLPELVLHNYVLRETLRLHAPIHSIIRKVKAPIPVPGTSHVIPQNHYVMAAPGVSAMDGQYFKNPLEFDPLRWAGSTIDEEFETDKIDYGYGLVSKGASSPYLPFGAGRHRCVGEQFANVQIGTILATFVKNFRFELPAGQQKISDPNYTSLIVMAEAPSNVVFIPRSKYAIE